MADARRVVDAARGADRDPITAARRLGVALSDHARVLQRAAVRAKAIEGAVDQAQADGVMRFFNSEYRRRREAAAKEGRSIMPYWAARAKMRQAIARRASGAVTPKSLMAEVLGA